MSNNKTISTRTGALAMVGLVLAAGILAAIAFSPTTAMAQESDRKERLERSVDRIDDARYHRLGIHVAKGAGIATDTETNENYRSGFRVIVQKVNDTESEFEVKRGMLGIFVEGQREIYTMLPETWSITLSEDGDVFEASGQVQNAEEQVFDVNLEGYFAMHTRLGNLWSIEGSLEGEDKDYDLHYVGISHGIRAASLD
ncbi:MAG: hypothetical protein ACREAQ_06335 [Nitrososphaera sp.]